jgi:hypothetical protein
VISSDDVGAGFDLKIKTVKYFWLPIFARQKKKIARSKQIFARTRKQIKVRQKIYSSGQKFLNDHSIWHNFFVSQPIDPKF